MGLDGIVGRVAAAGARAAAAAPAGGTPVSAGSEGSAATDTAAAGGWKVSLSRGRFIPAVACVCETVPVEKVPLVCATGAGAAGWGAAVPVTGTVGTAEAATLTDGATIGEGTAPVDPAVLPTVAAAEAAEAVKDMPVAAAAAAEPDALSPAAEACGATVPADGGMFVFWAGGRPSR